MLLDSFPYISSVSYVQKGKRWPGVDCPDVMDSIVKKVFKPIQPKPAFEAKRTLTENVCRGSHRNILRLLGKGFSQNLYYIEMEECDLSLEDYINHGKVAHGLPTWPTHPWPMDDTEYTYKQQQRVFLIVAILQQLLSGLVHIHKHNAIHGNLHPRNGTHIRITS